MIDNLVLFSIACLVISLIAALLAHRACVKLKRGLLRKGR